MLAILKNENDGNNGLNMASALLEAAFAGHSRDNLVEKLNSLQEKILKNFLNSDSVWEYANIDLELKEHGINIRGLNARNALAKYLGINYIDENAMIEEAIVLKNKGEYNKAFDKFKVLIEYNDKEPTHYHCAGHMKILDNKRDEAVYYLKKAVDLYLSYLDDNPEFAEYWFWAASACALMRDKDNSFEYLKNAVFLKKAFGKKARKEEDFEEYYDDPDFKKITER
jgi:tetratricopeptide (TPR) repeat protein